MSGIFDPFDTLGIQPKEWEPTDHSKPIEYKDSIDPINEERVVAKNRVKRGFEKMLNKRLDELYGTDKE